MDLNAFGAVPVLPFQSGVCGLCHYWAPLGRMYCDSCVSSCATYGFEVDPNNPMIRSSSSGKSQIAVGLQMFMRANSNSDAYKSGWQYKAIDVSTSVKEQAQHFIRELLEFGLSHEGCLAKKLDLPQKEFDVVTWVPTKKVGAPEHELGKILRHSSAGRRARSVLSFGSQSQIRIGGSDRATFNWIVNLNSHSVPESVLLVDDMWTSGETILSATADLFEAGVSRVGMLTLGRHVNSYGRFYSPDGIYEDFVRNQSIDTRFCTHCDSRNIMRPDIPLGERYGQGPEKHNAELFLQKVAAGPDWSTTIPRPGAQVVGLAVWCKEFKFGTVIDYFPSDDSVQIDFGIFRKRRFPINHPALRWKPEPP